MKKKLSLFIIILTVFFKKACLSQVPLPLFADGDRVCFIGSSIAMNGTNFHYINLFYATRHPDSKVKFLNSGISGEGTSGIISRIESDILINHPTWALLMIGANDLHSDLYSKDRQNEPGILDKRQTRLDVWFNNADSIVQKLLQGKCKVILITPPIFDQTGHLPGTNAYGKNDDLKKCAIYLQQLANKYKLPLVDFWTILNKVTKKIQQKDSTQTIIGRDRVHPGNYGHFVMAYQFLKTLDTVKQVSHISIDAKQNKISQQYNCTVSNLKTTTRNLSFTALGKSLPFPSPDGLNVDSLHPFTDELNAEIVQVKGLASGNYKLAVDTNVTGIYSNKELEKGVNLSQNKNTPQYQQAGEVLILFNDYWKTERILRVLKYVEYQHRLSDLNNKEDMEEVKKKFAAILEKNKSSDNYGFFKNVFDVYLTDKSHEKELELKLGSILNKIYQVNIPVKHSYKIELTR